MNKLQIGPDSRRLPRMQRGRLFLLLFFIVLGLTRLFVFELVIVQGDAMAPNALEGDVLLVGRRDEPTLGSVVMFTQGERTVLRRVVALAGDRISTEEGILMINDLPLETRVVGTFSFRYGADAPDMRRQQNFIEVLPKGEAHQILGDYVGMARPWVFEVPADEVAEDPDAIIPPHEGLEPIAPIRPVQTVPKGHVFVLCDNRRSCAFDELLGVVPMAWSRGVARSILWYGDARKTPPEYRPIYGAFDSLASRAGSGVK